MTRKSSEPRQKSGQSAKLKLPYGLADFPTLIRDGYEYVDRTAHIHDVEDFGPLLLFIRPRRFGKSLWLRTLAAYYDLRTRDRHDELFGRLAIGRQPTPHAHQYFVLTWDFSAVSPRGTVDDVAETLNNYVNTTIESFLVDYHRQLPEVAIHEDAKNTFFSLLAAIRQTDHRLYLLIDEYDNFANEIMTRDEAAYKGLVHGDGPFKELMKTVKAATQGEGLERLFVTGVSPVVMSDVSSGMNILTDVYQRPELNALCGFRDAEIEDLLSRVRQEGGADWSREEARRTIRDWYNGYRFSPMAEEKVYNPTMALYFLDHLQRYGQSPRQLLDANLAADEDKLRFVGEVISGQQSLLDLLQEEKPLEIPQLSGRIKLSDVVDRSSDLSFLASFLTFFGMLTIEGESPAGALRLALPNLAMRKLYADLSKYKMSTAAFPKDPYPHIDFDTRGAPVIAGTTMKVVELVMAQAAHGWSPEELHFQHPELSMSEIHAALAYYWDFKKELDADIERRTRFVEESRREAGTSPLVERLRRLSGGASSSKHAER